MRASMILKTAGVAMTLAAGAASALANGVTRDLDVNTNNHSAFGIGANAGALTGGFGYGSSPGWFTNNNPSSTAKPYSATGSSQDAILFTDVAAPGSSTGFGNNLVGGRNTVSQMSTFHWYIGLGGAARFAPNGTAASAATAFTQSYTNNTSSVVMSNIGTSTANVTLRIDTIVSEGAGDGQANVYAVATITRNTATSGNTSPISVSLGSLVGLDIGASAATDVLTDISGSGEKRVRFTDGSNFGEAVGFNPTSWGAGLSTGSGSLDATLVTSGALTNSIVNANPTDAGAGFVWNVNLANVGDSATFALAFSINQTAVPAPGAAALLGLGGLMVGRRRRA